MEDIKIDVNLIIEEYEKIIAKLTRESILTKLENEELKKRLLECGKE